ncbi:MAG: Fe-S cluster assembly sulfur transfer protein SufU, partial [Vulcanimicrobiaceae bacterium]
MDDFYKEYILDHYRNPRNFGTLENADASAEDLNPLCGDRIRFELALDDEGRVRDVRFSGRGCAISQASASMLSGQLVGKSLDEVAKLGSD